MKSVVGVRLRNTGESNYFDPKGIELNVGDKVIVEKDEATDIGTVSVPVIDIDEEKAADCGVVLRHANEEDLEILRTNKEDEKEAYKICQEKIREHELPMKLIQTEYTFERNKLLFYFTADGRVDFRELVKDLAAIFHTRIELRQVGVRDETKFIGGIGICGREFCCRTFLTEFDPVSIKMAKEQKLSLNPTKISGVCGRLMCCLKNEEETYEYLNGQLPNRGDIVTTTTGREGMVHAVSVLKQKVSVLFEENDEKEILEFPVSELSFKRKKNVCPHKAENTEQELEIESEIIFDEMEETENKSQKKRGYYRGKKRKKSPTETE